MMFSRMHVVALYALVSASACAGSKHDTTSTNAPPPKAAAVGTTLRLAALEPTNYNGKTITTGDLRPDQSAQLGFSVPGVLLQVNVRRGQMVKAGDVLGRLDEALARASVAQAAAGLAAAEAQARIAADAAERIKPLRATSGVSDAQMVQAESNRQLAAAQVEVAKAQLAQAEVNLRYQTLKAPFSGLVTRVPEGTGVTVGAGMPVFGLEGTGTLVLATSINLDEADSLQEGSKVTVTTPATSARTEEAIVRAVVKSADPMNHRLPVEISVPNRDNRFTAHAFARAELGQGEARPAYKVPSGALVQHEGAFLIWVVGADGTARMVHVQVLDSQSETATVATTEAIGQGDRVVDLPPVDISERTRIAAVSP